jgi:hypothetical protein
MSKTPPDEAERVLAQLIYINGANRPFRELTLDDVRARADELRAATGWGPMARVAPIALAWRELVGEMEQAGAATVSDLPTERVIELGPKLWVVLPGMR